ncbi:hypothetical protein [Streptomyces canus]|nr:hypothetical protein [Streptomyces canus]
MAAEDGDFKQAGEDYRTAAGHDHTNGLYNLGKFPLDALWPGFAVDR